MYVQMKVIKEHGPPVFDANESAHDMLTSMQQQQRPCSTTTDASGASQSGVSGSARTHASQSDTDGEDAADGAADAADGLSKSHSGVSHSSTATGSVGAAAGAAVVKQEPDDPAAMNDDVAAAVAAVSTAAGAAAAAGKEEEEEEADCGGLVCCDAPQLCSPAQQKKTISTLKHMNTGVQAVIWRRVLAQVIIVASCC
jgi:hypothetical protein